MKKETNNDSIQKPALKNLADVCIKVE